MFPNQFAYHRPTSVPEAVKLLGQMPDAKLLAGGHSLIPAMKLRLAAPSALIDLGRVEGLTGISVNGGATIGAMVTYNQIEDSKELRAAYPMLSETAGRVGDAQVRARGTLGGSLAHSDPGADMTAVFLALGGSVKVVGSGGERTISADDLFVDFFTTTLSPDEVITEVTFPALGGKTGMAYEKHEHPASGYAVVGVAAVVSVGGGGTCDSARIAVTGATSKATRASNAEQALVGQALNADAIAKAAAVATDGLEISGEIYASEEYRRHLVKVMTKRALERAAAMAGG